jgi:hypothetical protein
MEIPRQAREDNRKLSQRGAELLDRAAVHPEAARPEDFGDYDLPALVAAFPYPVQTWPAVVGGKALAELRRATTGVPRLLALIPERVFDNDVRRIGQFYGFPDLGFLELALRPPNGLLTPLTRGDFYHTPAGFQCLEVNVSVRLGGWHLRCFIDRLYYQKPWLRDLLLREEAPAVYVDPLFELYEALVGHARSSGMADGPEVNVVFAHGSPAELAVLQGFRYGDYLRQAYAEFLASRHPELRGEVVLTTYDALREEGHRLWLGRRRVHVLLENHGPFTNPTAFRVFKAGGVCLFNGPGAMILDNRQNLALLSEHAESDRFDAEERALIRSHIPWTRITRPGTVEYQGERASLTDLVLARRESMVLKHVNSTAGKLVYVGAFLSPAEWAETVRKAFSQAGWIVQERQVPLPGWYLDDAGGVSPYDVVWGTFSFGGHYGGGFLRIQPSGKTGVINSAQGATQAMYLEVEKEEGADE